VKTALITGVGGQDGAYLARLLQLAGYRVIGTIPIPAPDQEFMDAYLTSVDVRVVDMTDRAAMRDLLGAERPDEIYNLASISSVGRSWGMPVETAAVNGVAVLSLLEEVRALRGDDYEPRICQASSAEMFGTPQDLPQDESTPIRPDNPYAVAKAFAHHSAVSYRHAYGMFVCNAILFNHESPLRPASFVTGKISAGVAQIATGRSDLLELGRLDIKRDWGAAPDYVAAMHAMVMADEPDDFIVATGQSHELGEFVRLAFAAAGIDDPQPYVRSNPAFFRPTDIPETRGNPAKAEAILGWRRNYPFERIVTEMVQADLQRLESGTPHDPSWVQGVFT
jgi:GDPmannose 4,6-dehydratase